MNSPVPSNPPATTAWDRYQPWRRLFEVGFWVANYAISAIANSVVVLMDVSRARLRFADWQPVVWETSSSLAALLLIPAVVWFTRRVPLHLDTWTPGAARYRCTCWPASPGRCCTWAAWWRCAS